METLAAAPLDASVVSEDEFILRCAGRRKKKAGKPLTIRITSAFTSAVEAVREESPLVNPHSSVPNDCTAVNPLPVAMYSFDSRSSDELEQQMVDSMAFFQDTHEDQDPAFIAFSQKLAEEDRQSKLAALDTHDQQTRIEIESIFSDLQKEKQEATDRTLDKYKQRAADEEKIKLEKYHELYRLKTANNMRQINEGIAILQQRHQKGLQNAMGQHQQQVRNRRLNEQMAAAEWNATSQSITDKFNQQMTAFRNKGNDLKKQTETDYQREQDKIHKQHLARLQEADSSRLKYHARLHQQIQQRRQRYLKQHLQKLMKDKEELLSQSPAVITVSAISYPSSIENVDSEEGDLMANALRSFPSHRDKTKSTSDERTDLNPSSPIRSAGKWVETLPYPVAGASARHKHRKGVLSQTVRQLSIEIHNEGLWLSACPPESAGDKKNESNTSSASTEYEFVPWGTKAYHLLEAIVVGEIPPGICVAMLEKHADAKDIMSMQSGQVRCIVSDMRTSEETASTHRVVALSEQEQYQLKELEQKISEMQKAVAESETNCARAVQDEKNHTVAAMDASDKLTKATRIQEDFKQKFKSFLGPDGNPIPEATSATDRMELSKALTKYNTDLEAATMKAKTAKQAQADAKSKIQKMQAVLKLTQTNFNATVAEYKLKQLITANGPHGDKPVKPTEAVDVSDLAFFRLKDVVGALRKTASRRRDQADQKKSTSFSSAWVQSFPGLPSSLKKSLWHKMHRRKQQIILRPSPESLITDLRTDIGALVASKFSGRSIADKMEKIETEQLKAEQLFLLAMHPFIEETLATVPPTKSSDSWAEPGWQLNLSVYDDGEERSQMILPCAKSFPVMESNLAEIASAPGRQAASLLRPSHFSCLASPLSTFAVASSPAESNTSLTSIRSYSDGDPLHVSDDEMNQGYAFTVNAKQQMTRSFASKKKPTSAKTAAEMDTSGDISQASDSHIRLSEQTSTEPKKTEAKRRRSNTKKATSTSVIASRAKKPKQSVAPLAPTVPVAGTHFNPMMQQQQQPLPIPQQQQRQTQAVHHQQQQQQRQALPSHQVIQPQRQPQHQVQRQQGAQHHHHQQHTQHQQIPQQQQYTPQMNNPMMQQAFMQQQTISPRHQQVPANFPPQAIQQMQQFYTPMHLPGRSGPPHQPPPA